MRLRHLIPLALSALLGPQSVIAADPTAPVIGEEEVRIEANRESQRQVDRIYQKTTDLVGEYENRLKIVDGLRVYNTLLERQLLAQDQEIDTIKSSIANATVIERQMMPLLLRMLEGLEEFIRLDVPFLLQEREQRVVKLRGLMERADLTVAEKTRRVFEAFQIENDYGRTLEAYKGKIDLGDRSYDVDYLRIGRIALLYRSAGDEHFGHWDLDSRSWVQIGENQFRRNLDKGVSIARKEIAPELFTVPIQPAAELSP